MRKEVHKASCGKEPTASKVKLPLGAERKVRSEVHCELHSQVHSQLHAGEGQGFGGQKQRPVVVLDRTLRTLKMEGGDRAVVGMVELSSVGFH